MELTQEKRREFDTMTDVALRQLKESTHAKHDRMARISEFEKDYKNLTENKQDNPFKNLK